MKISCLQLSRDEEGLASIEFALVLPLFAALFLGTFTLFEMYVQRDNIQNSTNVLSDLMSRQLQVDNEFLGVQHGLHMSLNKIANPDDAPMTVTSIENFVVNSSNPNNVITENRAVWKYDSRTGSSTKIETNNAYTKYALPRLAPGETVIVVEASAKDTPIFDYFGFGATDYKNVAVLTPRYTNRIVNTDAN